MERSLIKMFLIQKLLDNYNKKFYEKEIQNLLKDIKYMSNEQLIEEDKGFICREDFGDGNKYTRKMHEIIENEMQTRGIECEGELREKTWFAQRGM